MPFELVDPAGAVVGPVAAYLRDVQACGRSEATLRRMGWTCCGGSGSAGRRGWMGPGDPAEAADFCRWMPIAGKPGSAGGYAPATAAHCETVLRHFYDFHLEAGTGPMVNPFPLARGRGRAPGAHHNPMQPFPRGSGRACSGRGSRSGRRGSIPDQAFNDLFAGLASHRDRALIAFYISTGARAVGAAGRPRGWSPRRSRRSA